MKVGFVCAFLSDKCSSLLLPLPGNVGFLDERKKKIILAHVEILNLLDIK